MGHRCFHCLLPCRPSEYLEVFYPSLQAQAHMVSRALRHSWRHARPAAGTSSAMLPTRPYKGCLCHPAGDAVCGSLEIILTAHCITHSAPLSCNFWFGWMQCQVYCVCAATALSLLQFLNPYHLWMIWDPAVRHQGRCLARHNQLITDKVARLISKPPAAHTIAGTPRLSSLT